MHELIRKYFSVYGLLIEEVELKQHGELFAICYTAGYPRNIVPDVCITFGKGVHFPSDLEVVLLRWVARRVTVMGTGSLVVMDVADLVGRVMAPLCNEWVHLCTDSQNVQVWDRENL